MIRNTISMYSGERSALRKPLRVAGVLLACAAATAGASTAVAATVAATGQNVVGLTLTTTQAPSSLPTKLPGGLPYKPPAGKVFQGVAGKPVSEYVQTAGKHPAIYQEFVAWGQWLPTITQDAKAAHSRLMMMVSTRFGARNMISPYGIATGAGDQWLIGLAQQLAAS